MGYCGPMGYGMQFPANQVGGSLELWDIRGYGFSGVWVMRGPTVPPAEFECSPSVSMAVQV